MCKPKKNHYKKDIRIEIYIERIFLMVALIKNLSSLSEIRKSVAMANQVLKVMGDFA